MLAASDAGQHPEGTSRAKESSSISRKLGSLSNRALLVNDLFDVGLYAGNPCVAVVYSSPRLLCRFDLEVRAISIRRRIASEHESVSFCCLAPWFA
jgi:hypothetical protein